MKKVKQKNNNFLHATRYTLHAMRAFSLIETIVAIAILSFVVVAPLSLAQRGLNASVYAKEQITAFYLAQEAIEYARNVRDANNFAGRSRSSDWLLGLDNCKLSSGGPCGVDVTADGSQSQPQTFSCAPDPRHCQLTFQSATGVYGERRDNNGNPDTAGGWQDTVYTRKLMITPFGVTGDPVAGADLVVTVSWQTGLITKSFSVNEKIFNWFPSPAL